MLKKIFFVRHGETEWNRKGLIQGQADIPLNENGVQQAEAAVERFNLWQPGICFCSPLIRAQKTAQLILNGKGIKIITDDLLKEISYGINEGQPLALIEADPKLALHKYFFEPENYIPPENGESIQALAERCEAFLKKLTDDCDNLPEYVLVVCHGAWIQAMIGIVDHRPQADFWHGKQQGNCSVTIIRVDGKKLQLEAEAI